MRSNYLGILIILFVLIGTMTMGGHLSLFLSLPGLLAVIGILLGALIFKFGFSWLTYAKRNRESRNQICNFASSISINAGILAAVVAFIQMFAQFNWNDPKNIGLAVSIALTTVFYGYALSLAFKLASAPSTKGI